MHRRRGVTLIELLVVVGVVGVLATLTLAAVQHVREAARATACRGNLRQIGVALHSYQSTFGSFPALAYADGTTRIDGREVAVTQRYVSPYASLLPHLEQSALHDGFNFAVSGQETFTNADGANATVKRTRLSVLLCPSDGRLNSPGVNYRFCTGSGPYFGSATDGAFLVFHALRPRDFTDGLAHTAAVAEKLTGDGVGGRHDRRRDFWYSGRGDLPLLDGPAAALLCGSPPPDPDHYSFAGSHWANGGYENTWYNHAATPDGGSDCGFAEEPTEPPTQGSFAASGGHAVVQLLAMDGSVRGIDRAVDVASWRSLASRRDAR